MKKLEKLGKVLSTKEQKNVNGGKPMWMICKCPLYDDNFNAVACISWFESCE